MGGQGYVRRMALLAALDVADDPGVWEALGFSVAAGLSVVGHTGMKLGAEGSGIVGWALADVGEDADVGAADGDGQADGDGDGGRRLAALQAEGLPTRGEDAYDWNPAPHPNGATSIDHLVVFSGQHERTVAAFERAGLPLLRTRHDDRSGKPMVQAFFRLDEVVLELVGPKGAGEAADDGPARFYGIAFNVADLDETAAYLGDRLKPAKDAVQAGRRIATVSSSGGSSVAMAFMSPHPGGPRRVR